MVDIRLVDRRKETYVTKVEPANTDPPADNMHLAGIQHEDKYPGCPVETDATDYKVC